MTSEVAGITRAGTGQDDVVWNILGQTYLPKQACESSFAFEAHSPAGTFVPPHIHPTQDEYILMMEGRLRLVLDGQSHWAMQGDLVRMPRGIMHGYFNDSGAFARAFFWEDAFSMIVLALHTAYLVALFTGVDATTQMLIALAAYAAYLINATQFVLKLRAARCEQDRVAVGASRRPTCGPALASAPLRSASCRLRWKV